MAMKASALVLVAACLLAAGCSLLPERSELTRIMREDDVARLRQDLQADRAWVREHAALRLGQLGAAQAVPDLEALLGADPDPWVRARSAEALGAIGVPSTAVPLAKAAGDDDVDVRLAVVAALAAIGGPEVEAALSALLADPNLLVRGAANEAAHNMEAQ